MWSKRFPLDVVALSCLLLLNGLCFFRLYDVVQRLSAKQEFSYVGDDFPSELPINDLREVVMEFTNDHYNISLDTIWDSIGPSHHGRVKLGPDGQEFHVAMYRQLHCVDVLRNAYLELHLHRPPSSENPDWSEADACIDILRQSILCTGDVTLDPAVVIVGDDGTLSSASTGVGVEHRCRDWTQVESAVVQNAALYS